MSPDQFRFDGFEERLDSRIVVTFTCAAHALASSGLPANDEKGHVEAVLTRDFLIITRTLLGGFNRSSQHPVLGGVNNQDRQTNVRTLSTEHIERAK